MRITFVVPLVLVALLCSVASGQVYNLKIVTDANPDYTDMDSMIHSITANWPTMKEKCWAMFYWNHIMRRQTTPMSLHGTDLTDPIMQANDYGYTMCSTVAGVNCGIWKLMGMDSRYWNISHHTVSECFYDGRWHLYDDSLSAVYTLCDGKTVAGVQDVGAEGACELSGGKKEMGHVALYHCLTATSMNGFLQGADVARDLPQEVASFAPESLKMTARHDWLWGHRYILNLEPGQAYTRYYRRLDKKDANDDYFKPAEYKSDPKYFVPNPRIKFGRPAGSQAASATSIPAARLAGDTEVTNPRYFIRGNGAWTFKTFFDADWRTRVYSSSNVKFVDTQGLTADKADQPGEVVFKVAPGNIITSIRIEPKTAGDSSGIWSISTNGGMSWTPIKKAQDLAYKEEVRFELLDEVNGYHQVLVKAELNDCWLWEINIRAVTEVNAKAQPRLNIGRNTIYVGAGDQTDSIVYWPDLRTEQDRAMAVEMQNVNAFQMAGRGRTVTLLAPGEGFMAFKMVSPRDITRITYGAKMCTVEKGSRVDFLHSFDDGKTWEKDYSQTENLPDPIHYVTVDKVPPGTRSVLYKYLIVGQGTEGNQLGITDVRMEADHKVQESQPAIAITFAWKERQKDYSLITRTHTENVFKLPHVYTINVGGEDHPVMEALEIRDFNPQVSGGYFDGRDVGGGKYQPRWVTYGKALSQGRKYTVSAPSLDWRGGGDPDGTRLTDGVIGPLFAGGPIPKWGMVWSAGADPEITVDLEKAADCGAFRFHMAAWPWWDALKGQMKDKVELLTSDDGKDFASLGFFDLNLRLKDVPANHMLPDEETAMGWIFEMIPPKPVKARYVRFKFTIVPVDGVDKDVRKLVVTEVQVLDTIKYEPFDFRLAAPKFVK